jgi:outer membrane protein assembly factor BamB
VVWVLLFSGATACSTATDEPEGTLQSQSAQPLTAEDAVSAISEGDVSDLPSIIRDEEGNRVELIEPGLPLDSWSNPGLPVPASALKVVGNHVIYEATTDNSVIIVVIDGRTGEEVHRLSTWPTGRYRGHFSWVTVDSDNGLLFRDLGWQGAGVSAHDISTGEQVWRVLSNSSDASSRSARCGNAVCLSTSGVDDFFGGLTMGKGLGSRNDQELRIDAASGELLSAIGDLDPRVIAANDEIHVRPGERDGGLAYDQWLVGVRTDGLEEVWRTPTEDLLGLGGLRISTDSGHRSYGTGQIRALSVGSAPVSGGIFVHQDLGTVFGLNFDTGEILWAYGNAEACGFDDGVVAVCQFGIPVSGDMTTTRFAFEGLIGVDLATGVAQWEIPFEGESLYTGHHESLVSITLDPAEGLTPDELLASAVFVDIASGLAVDEPVMIMCPVQRELDDELTKIEFPRQGIDYQRSVYPGYCLTGVGRFAADVLLSAYGTLPDGYRFKRTKPAQLDDGWWVLVEDGAVVGYRVDQ